MYKHNTTVTFYCSTFVLEKRKWTTTVSLRKLNDCEKAVRP